MAQLKARPEQTPLSNKEHHDPREVIKSRQTAEIILAVCGQIGAGTSSVIETFKEIFSNHSYDVHVIKISDFIRKHYDIIYKGDKTFQSICELQDKGNELRKKYMSSYLAQCAIEEISLKRNKGKKYEEIPNNESRRHITIIDSLKHPDELELLNLIYNEMFYLIGVVCSEDKRRERLEGIGFSKENVEKCMMRDRRESEETGQRTAEVLHRADFFVDNNNDTEQAHRQQLQRFVELLLGNKVHSPTNDEYAMFCAYASSLRSGCLSRQVGAAIVDKSGNLIATGRNDVPKYFGGLYCEDDGQDDHRCLRLNPPECRNDLHKKKLVSLIAEVVRETIKEVEQKEEIASRIFEQIATISQIKGLIEYSRAVHAEMDAITSVARLGGPSLLDSVLYCTTFPCHHCARHILSAGIKRVVFLEPYDKSLASNLHKDSIVVDKHLGGAPNKLHMEHFAGVAPRRYAQLFEYSSRKNSSGRRLDCDLKTALPFDPKYIDRHGDFELKVVEIKHELQREKGN